ncbi:MAG: DUF3352 domain-containing protein [Bacteroides sp.]|nr:DUF3352 domain-containing protein [Bacteroides sp.]
MQLKMIAKIGTIISVLLFCFAVGFYAFMRLEATGRSRDVNLFSLVPSDCVGVLESDRIQGVLNQVPMLNYNQELNEFHFPGLFDFFLSELDVYASDNVHGLSQQLDHFLVSFHEPVSSRNQVIYFRLGNADEQMLSDILQNYASSHFLPKEETYRGKTIFVYPLNHEEFIAAYIADEFFVVSYQKRLIEAVIDAQQDGTSLNDDALFAKIISRKKSSDFLTLYSQIPSMPLLETEQSCWCEYDFHLNSDVVYLTGETFVSDEPVLLETMAETIREIPLVNEPGLFISSDKDSTNYYMNLAYDANEGSNRLLFNECMANLSNEASFTMVVDMKKVVDEPERFQTYLSPFVLENAALFQPFILSAQYSLNGSRPSHMWVFTYKY